MWDQTASLDKVYKVNKHNYQAAAHVGAVNQIAEENVMITKLKTMTGLGLATLCAGIAHAQDVDWSSELGDHSGVTLNVPMITDPFIEPLAELSKEFEDGVIMQVDRPAELYRHPQNEFVAGFIGSPKMNFITATGSGGTLELEGGTSLTYSHISSEKCSRAAKLGVRPEHFDLSTENGSWKGKVVMGEEHGSEKFYQVQVEGLAQIIEVRDIGAESYAKGDSIWLSPQVEQSFIFDAEGNTIY